MKKERLERIGKELFGSKLKKAKSLCKDWEKKIKIRGG